jgi:hypothetical protein
MYNVNENTWIDLPPLPEGIELASAITIKNEIFITGTKTNIVFRFNVFELDYTPIHYTHAVQKALLTDNIHIYLVDEHKVRVLSTKGQLI